MTQLIIACDDNFEENSIAYTYFEEPLPEHEQIWVWDHYFALVMHRLGDVGEAEHLLETLANWAGGFAPQLFSNVNELHAKGALKIDTQLSLRPLPEQEPDEFYVIETQSEPNNWPAVRVKLPEQPRANRLAYSVIALAQYFLGKNLLFFRELPLHILSMRKFYLEQVTYSDASSVSLAPAFAMNTALKFFTDANAKAQAE